MSRYLGSLLFLAIVIGGGAEAFACSCAAPEALSPEQAEATLRELDLFAEAEITGFRSRERCYPDRDGTPFCIVESVADLSVIKSYKGAVGATVEIQLGAARFLNSCDPDFEVGQKRLVSAYFIAEPQRDDSFITPAGYSTSICTLYHSEFPPIRQALDRYRSKWQAMEAKVTASDAGPEDWRRLGQFLEEWRDYPRALEVYERARKLYPDDAAIQAGEGRMLFVLHRPAWPALQRAVALGDIKSKSLLVLEATASFASAGETDHLDLSGLDLRYKSFVDLRLSGSNFSNADLRFARFYGVRLSGADFRGANLNGIVMKDVVLRNADFSGTAFDPAHIEATDITGMKLRGVELRLDGFLKPKTPQASILKANLDGAIIDCGAWRAQVDLARQIKEQQPAARLTPECLTHLQASP